MEKLKTCPFCGWAGKLFKNIYIGGVGAYWIECTNSDCLIPEMSTQEYDTEKQVTEAWNKRA